jgi:hypothetical protein
MTARFVTLKMITSEQENRQEPDHEPGEDAGGEDDGFAQITDVQSASAHTRGARGAHIAWKPMTLSVDAIRNMYPRDGGADGTRILLKSGVKYIVLNEHAQIAAAIGDVIDLTAD